MLFLELQHNHVNYCWLIQNRSASLPHQQCLVPWSSEKHLDDWFAYSSREISHLTGCSSQQLGLPRADQFPICFWLCVKLPPRGNDCLGCRQPSSFCPVSERATTRRRDVSASSRRQRDTPAVSTSKRGCQCYFCTVPCYGDIRLRVSSWSEVEISSVGHFQSDDCCVFCDDVYCFLAECGVMRQDSN